MPVAIAGWIAGALGVASGTLAFAAIQLGVSVVFSAAVARLTQPKGKSPRDNQIEIRQSNAPRTRYVGHNRVSGVLMYADVHDKALWKLWAVAQGGHNGVVQWYVGDEPRTLTSGMLTGATAVASGTRLWTRKGRADEINGGAYPELIAAAPAWTADHRLFGVGTILARHPNVKAEKAHKYYPQGEPRITAVISGDSCLNPSMDWGPTANIARQLYDILTHVDYGPLTHADMDAASWNTAISDCNEDVITTGGGTRRRYEGGGGYQLNEPIKDVADRWCEAMAGTLYVTTEGKAAVRAGVWRAPTYTITEDKIVAMEYGAGADLIDGVSTLVAKYTSSALGYHETSAEPWEDADAVARWGETAAKELPLPIVQHHGQARALAEIKLAKMNPKWRFTMRLRFWGLLLLEEQVVAVTLPRLGITDEPFWIDKLTLDLDGSDGIVTVELSHARPETFERTIIKEGTPPALPPATTGGATSLDAPVITSVVVDSGTDSLPFIRVTASVTDDAQLIGQFRRSGTTDPWTYMNREGDGGTLRTLPLGDQREYDIRVAAIPGLGNDDPALRSAWAYSYGIAIIANTTAPDAPQVVSHSGTAGGSMTVTFMPDLGVNYRRTGLYRTSLNAAFDDTTRLAWSYATSAEVTMTAAVPAGGARYWLRSENASGVTSAATLIGQYT